MPTKQSSFVRIFGDVLDKFGPNPIAIDVVENLRLNFIISTDPLSLGRLQAFDSPHIILDWHLEGVKFRDTYYHGGRCEGREDTSDEAKAKFSQFKRCWVIC